MPSEVTKLVHAMIDAAHAEHPGAEFSISLHSDAGAQLEHENETSERTVNEVRGYYVAPEYRGAMIWETPALVPHLVILQSVVDDGPSTSYYGDLRNGKFGTDFTIRV